MYSYGAIGNFRVPLTEMLISNMRYLGIRVLVLKIISSFEPRDPITYYSS